MFPEEWTARQLSASTLLFSITIVLNFLTHLIVPFTTLQKSVVSLYSVTFTYAVVATPFVFSGISVCLVLTRFPRQVSRLYAADLIGAAAGCIAIILLMRVTDGPTAVVVVAAIAAVGAWVFSSASADIKLRTGSAVAAALLLVFAAGNTVLARRQNSLLRLMWVKGEMETKPLHETWNSFSRVTVNGNPDRLNRAVGWGISSTYPANRTVRQLNILIDSTA